MSRIGSVWQGHGPRRVALAGAAILAAGLAAAESERCPGAVTTDRVAGFEDGVLRLVSGTRLRLVDLRPAGAGPAGARLRAVLGALAGEEVRVTIVDEPDRWERRAGSAQIGGAVPFDLAELLVGEGLALVDAGPRETLCRPGLLATEAASRARRLGLWAEEGAFLRADDPAALAAAAGRFVVVEGRVVSVGVRRERTYLNFGRDFSRDFAATIPRRTWATLLARGHTAESLRGAAIRVRGIVEMRRAPSLDLVVADMLEIVTPARRPAVPRSE